MEKETYTTDEAFEIVLSSPELWQKTGRPVEQRIKYLHKYRNQIPITADLKEKILRQAGCQIAQNTLWNEPTFTSKKYNN
ncbi:hypothetical protein [Spirosoma endbachense]|uniref:Uncharacterized protein n=1 Tax=Spirosoma endbachense TaxID=2666025 RepID=A0A6P1W2Q0_9BACT|nr:hypothetical protein [Spirosoma endbachense]QHV98279.1 hypothetical protein GJR95_26220 [Spirosoma endbachense]